MAGVKLCTCQYHLIINDALLDITLEKEKTNVRYNKMVTKVD